MAPAAAPRAEGSDFRSAIWTVTTPPISVAAGFEIRARRGRTARNSAAAIRKIAVPAAAAISQRGVARAEDAGASGGEALRRRLPAA
jgi:hypothetical protein